ncbi:MAG: hypothetical protein ACTS5Y_07360 [Pollutimonas bauzanensis]
MVLPVFQFGYPAGIDVEPQDLALFTELDRQRQAHVAQTNYGKFHILNFQLVLPGNMRKERRRIL